MEKETYIKERERLTNELKALDEKLISEADIKVNDVIVDENGSEYIVRTVKINSVSFNVYPFEISIKKKNKEWSEAKTGMHVCKGKPHKKGTDIEVSKYGW